MKTQVNAIMMEYFNGKYSGKTVVFCISPIPELADGDIMDINC